MFLLFLFVYVLFFNGQMKLPMHQLRDCLECATFSYGRFIWSSVLTAGDVLLLLDELRRGLLHGHLQAAAARDRFARCHILLSEDGH